MKVGLTPSDAAYNNPGYCRGDNYRWRTALIRVKRFRSRHDMTGVYLVAVRCASRRRLICKNELQFSRYKGARDITIHCSLSPLATVENGKIMFTTISCEILSI